MNIILVLYGNTILYLFFYPVCCLLWKYHFPSPFKFRHESPMFALISPLKNMTENSQATTANGGEVRSRPWVPNRHWEPLPIPPVCPRDNRECRIDRQADGLARAST